MNSKIAIIQFPGSNCEYETKVAIESTGVKASIVRWNTDLDELKHYDGFVLPGGFSYQDRVRAGAISAKLPIIDVLLEANKQDKPILGICNGCQVLAEIGLVPDLNENQTLQMALTHNKNSEEQIGFICDWVYLKVEHPNESLFTKGFKDNEILPIQINHGEGRFIFAEEIKQKISECTHFYYCNEKGEKSPSFPVNPNGSEFSCAGLTNKKGNVLAIMPHPERACFLKQIPTYLNNKWADSKRVNAFKSINIEGPWHKLFNNMSTYINTITKKDTVKEHQH